MWLNHARLFLRCKRGVNFLMYKKSLGVDTSSENEKIDIFLLHNLELPLLWAQKGRDI